MTGHELLTNYPKAANIIRKWFLDKMLESLKTDKVSDDFKEAMKARGVPDDALIPIIDHNPRALFDVFDNEGIFIDIYIGDMVGEISNWEVSFGYKVLPLTKEEAHKPIVWFDTRREAEAEAVKVAFKKMNK